MKFPIQPDILFNKTKENLIISLNNFYKTDQQQFNEMFHADINQVLNTYFFENEGVSWSRSFSYDPPLDYISVWIRIYDNENDYTAEYTAFYDLELNYFDDRLK